MIFWKDWDTGEKSVFYLLLIAIVASLGYMGWCIYYGDSLFVDWNLKGQIEILTHPLMSFTQDFFDITLTADSFLVINRFIPTAPQIQSIAYAIPMLMYILALVTVMAASTYLNGFSYLSVLVIWVLGVATLDFEGMGIYLPFLPEDFMEGKKAKFFLYAVLGTFLPLNLLFKSVFYKIEFWVRYLVFAVLTVLFGYLCLRYATQTIPAIHGFGYGISVPIFVGLIFLSFSAHEPIRAFLVMVGSNGMQGYRQWMIFSAVYLLNIVYAFVHYRYGVNWGIYFLDPFVLMGISCLLGIWGTYIRRRQYEHITAAPYAVFLFMALALIMISQISLAVRTANDPLTGLYRNFIMIAHLGFGLAFIFHVLLNFMELFKAHQPVYKVVFNPKHTDFWLVWSFGIIVMFGAFFGKFKQTYHAGISASYNIIGSKHYLMDELLEAKQNWVLSKQYSPFGHFNNYMLANILLREKRPPVLVKEYLENSVVRHPKPHVYAYISEIMAEDNSRLFQAIFALREGISVFPHSGELHNNLALLFNKTRLADSVQAYFDKALKYSHYREIVESNQFALWAKYRQVLSPDSLFTQRKMRRYLGTLANEVAFVNATGQPNTRPIAYDLLPDSALDTKALTYLYNLALNPAMAMDTVLPKKIEYYLINGANRIFQANLQVALAVLYFQRGRSDYAFELMEQAVNSAGETDAFTSHVFGCWLLLAGQYERATQYLSVAFSRGNQDSALPLAIAQTYSAPEKARKTWNTLLQTQDERAMHARMMLRALDSSARWTQFSDREKYYTLRFGSISKDIEQKILSSITEKKILQAYLSEKILSATTQNEAQPYFERLSALGLEEYHEAELAYKRLSGQFDERFAQLLQKNVSVYRIGHIQHYRALYLAHKGDTTEAEKAFAEALALLPLEIDLYMDAARFYAKQPEKAYDVLLKGVRLNPEAPDLLEAYILICFERKLINFAKQTWQDYQKLPLPAERVAKFSKIYAQKLSESEKLPEGWE